MCAQPAGSLPRAEDQGVLVSNGQHREAAAKNDSDSPSGRKQGKKGQREEGLQSVSAGAPCSAGQGGPSSAHEPCGPLGTPRRALLWSRPRQDWQPPPSLSFPAERPQGLPAGFGPCAAGLHVSVEVSSPGLPRLLLGKFQMLPGRDSPCSGCSAQRVEATRPPHRLPLGLLSFQSRATKPGCAAREMAPLGCFPVAASG